jgi:hypothetical protein
MMDCSLLNQEDGFVPTWEACFFPHRMGIPQLPYFQSLELYLHPSFGPCLAVPVRGTCVFLIIANLWRGSRIGSVLASVIPARGCASPSPRQGRPGKKMRSIRGFSRSGKCLQATLLSAENCLAVWMGQSFRGSTACLVPQLRRCPELLPINNVHRLNGLLLAG